MHVGNIRVGSPCVYVLVVCGPLTYGEITARGGWSAPPTLLVSVWAGLSHYWQDSPSIQGNEFHPRNRDRSNQHEGALWNHLIIRLQTRGINWFNICLFEDPIWWEICLDVDLQPASLGLAYHCVYVRNSMVKICMHEWRQTDTIGHITCVSPAHCATIWKDTQKKAKINTKNKNNKSFTQTSRVGLGCNNIILMWEAQFVNVLIWM